MTTTGEFTEFSSPGIRYPGDLTVGPDGRVWFINRHDDSVGRIDSHGRVAVVTQTRIPSLRQIATGSDGSIWLGGGAAVGELKINGKFGAVSATPGEVNLARGPDGFIWFSSADRWPLLSSSGTIGKMTPHGAVTILIDKRVGTPSRLASGPDGALWFTERATNAIGRITIQGKLTIFRDRKINRPQKIVAGPDGALWFTNQGPG